MSPLPWVEMAFRQDEVNAVAAEGHALRVMLIEHKNVTMLKGNRRYERRILATD